MYPPGRRGTRLIQCPVQQRFRGGLVFKAHGLCVSLNARLESNKEEEEAHQDPSWQEGGDGRPLSCPGGELSQADRVVALHQFGNNYFTEMCSGSEAGSYLRLIDCVYHSTRVIKKKRRS